MCATSQISTVISMPLILDMQLTTDFPVSLEVAHEQRLELMEERKVLYALEFLLKTFLTGNKLTRVVVVCRIKTRSSRA